jgi:hypothetical protein
MKQGARARLPWAALLLFVAAVAGFGLANPDYAQTLHPVALLGARGEPNALAFNVLGFVLPGMLLVWHAVVLRNAWRSSSWSVRVAVQLGLLSALAFLAQGLLPLDPYNLLAPISRWHATAWTLWWVAFVPGALLLALSRAQGRARGLSLALLLPAFALFGAVLMPAALAQRIAYLLWFAWWLLAARDRGIQKD